MTKHAFPLQIHYKSTAISVDNQSNPLNPLNTPEWAYYTGNILIIIIYSYIYTNPLYLMDFIYFQLIT